MKNDPLRAIIIERKGHGARYGYEESVLMDRIASFVGEAPESMYQGMIITYRIRPVLGIPVTWVTEITQVDEPLLFVDEQRFGPYRFWQHKHLFRAIEGGVEMEDIVDYILPLGLLSAIPHALLIKRQLKGIFDYRERVLRRLFGEIP